MTGATTLVRALLWALSALLTLFVAAMSVSPQAAAANIARWLVLLGLRSSSAWFTSHAHNRVHLSADAITRTMTAKCAAPCTHVAGASSSSFEVSELVLIAIAALVTALVLIWLMRRRPRSLLAS
jgi:hypothetical protein